MAFPANKSGKTKVFFQSTRGGIRGVSFEEAVLSGYAPDGGLLVPELVPLFTAAQLRAMAGLSFAGVVAEVVSMFAGDEIPKDELVRMARRAYAARKWGGHADVLPLVRVGAGPRGTGGGGGGSSSGDQFDRWGDNSPSRMSQNHYFRLRPGSPFLPEYVLTLRILF